MALLGFGASAVLLADRSGGMDGHRKSFTDHRSCSLRRGNWTTIFSEVLSALSLKAFYPSREDYNPTTVHSLIRTYGGRPRVLSISNRFSAHELRLTSWFSRCRDHAGRDVVSINCNCLCSHYAPLRSFSRKFRGHGRSWSITRAWDSDSS
jgi:hypothetical protein